MKLNMVLPIAVIIIVIVVGAIIAPVSATELTETVEILDPESDIVGFQTEDLISIDGSIKNATPYYVMLVGTEDQKQSLCELIDESSAKEKEKQLMKEYLQEIWEKYPVVFSKEETAYGTITYISFANSMENISLTEDENHSLGEIDATLADASSRLYGSIGLRWSGTVHQDIISVACQRCAFPDAQYAVSAADDPDGWPASIPWFVPQELHTPINAVFHSWHHYYSPWYGWGGAPGHTKSYVDEAKTYHTNGQTALAAQSLGWSSHFLTDVGNPMHTGKEIEQYAEYLLGNDIHGAYEAYVTRNWPSKFKPTVTSNYNYYTYADWDSGCKNLAISSHADLDTVYTIMYHNRDPSVQDSHSQLETVTRNNILQTAKYTNGLARYAKGL
ncbi:phospholipase C/P1 nuclease family protein [Methanoculleus sp. 7T]|uniref:hypothetical protein n=1 Tax=Methanoculleus sp. 7T TaxID=2937282 RepID=UPI0020C15E90|nr:hypothetical protein [Methanoculleus sp. 7T]MCK8518448.1 hypothetical protein [Methanoculleus sp. 7T]